MFMNVPRLYRWRRFSSRRLFLARPTAVLAQLGGGEPSPERDQERPHTLLVGEGVLSHFHGPRLRSQSVLRPEDWPAHAAFLQRRPIHARVRLRSIQSLPPFNVDIIHYNPVCLNSLLYVMERDSTDIMAILGHKSDAATWRKLAEERKEKINRLMWGPGDGLYYDYNFTARKIRRYRFLTAFYPLWAGIATPEQAARVESNLKLFEHAGGLETSTNPSGSQWDAPFGWAPLEMLAVEGLRRYRC
jgi:hypothetical protein